jgi:hypothetical protein
VNYRLFALLLVLSGAGPASAQEIAQLSLPTNALVYDQSHDKVYASVPGRAGVNGNSIAVIDPHSGAVEQYVWVGSEPNQLALSRDGQYLYVALDGSYSIRRVSLPAVTPGPQFYVGRLVAGISVMPGAPATIAVLWGDSNPDRVAIYDDGVKRALTVGWQVNSAASIAFGADGSALYGWGSGSPQLFTTMAVDASGVTFISETCGLATGNGPIESHGGRLYSTAGAVDPVRHERVGSYPRISYEYGDAAALSPEGDRAFVLVGWPDSMLRAIDTSTFRLLWSMELPSIDRTYRGSMVSGGANRVLFREPDADLVHVIDVGSGRDLRVSKAGAGDGSVASAPAGLVCAGDCTGRFAAGATVTLTVTPGSNSRFVGWEGDADCSDGTVTMASSVSCTAVFAQLTSGLGVELPLKVNSLAFSPLTQKLYASIPGASAQRGNTVTAIDPMTGEIGPSVWVGSEPTKLAVSSDGGTLYVSLDGESSVRRVDLNAMTAEARFPLGLPSWGDALQAIDLAVLPGDADSVAVVRGTWSDEGIAVFTNGVMRPSVAPLFYTDSLAFSALSSRLYAISSSEGFVRLNVGPSGVEVVDKTRNLIDTAGTIRFAEGRIYTSAGQALDPESLTVLGRFTVNLYQSLVALPPGVPAVYYLDADGQHGGLVVKRFDPERFTLNEATETAASFQQPRSFVSCGAGELAFSTNEGRVALFTPGALVRDSITVTADADESATISVGPPDYYDRTDGFTPFTRLYPRGSGVTLVAPAMVGAKTFSAWTWGYTTLSTSRTLALTLEAGGTVTAHYVYAAPTVTGVNPAAGTTAGGTEVTITGTGFHSPMQVFFGGRPATSIVVVNPTTITVRTPPGSRGVADVSVSTVEYLTGFLAGAFNYLSAPRDFDGDAKADVAVYRPASGTWFWLESSTSNQAFDYRGWGVQAQGDVPVRGDFDGDGVLDPTVFRPDVGTWFILESHANYSTWRWYGWGAATDTLMPADYDGDGRMDAAVYRASTGTWYILPSSGASQWSVVFGAAGDIPIAGDFDGDGKGDVAVYRPASGTWFWLKSSTSFTAWDYRGWGVEAQGDIPVPGDYDGDGKADFCVFRPATGTWFVLESHANFSTWTWYGWGQATDTLVPADYDGDGKTDVAVYRPSSGTWYVRPSSGSSQWSVVFGAAGDVPLLKVR